MKKGARKQTGGAKKAGAAARAPVEAKAPERVAARESGAGAGAVPIKRQCLKSRPLCKVTLCLPAEAADGARSVTVVGDFNGWDEGATPLKRLKDGSYSVVLELESGRQYRFRYLIDGTRWENHWCADGYAPNQFGGEDSVVAL